MKKNTIINILGWYGVAAILSAYILLNLNVVSSQSMSYQLLNVTGAICIAYDSFKDKDYQPVVLNIIWAIVAVIAIVKILT